MLLRLKQSCVLDRDYRLIGEGGQQLYMLIVKWPYGVSTYEKYADQIRLAEQWQTEVRAKSAQSLNFPQTVVRVGKNVGDLYRLPLQQNSPDHALPSRRDTAGGHNTQKD